MQDDPNSASATDIYQSVYDEIVVGVVGPGAFLREESLAARFGVSRTPVREALHRLETERLIERWKRGRRVPTLSYVETVQSYDLRALLEGEAAAQAAESRSVADLLELDRLSAVVHLDASNLGRIEINLAFHKTLWTAAHNAVLDDALGALISRMLTIRDSTLIGERWAATLEEHRLITDAVRHHDADGARRLSTAHVDEAKSSRMTLMDGAR